MVEMHDIQVVEIPGAVTLFCITGYPGETEVYLYREALGRRWCSLSPPAPAYRHPPAHYWPHLTDLVEHCFPEA